MQMWKLKKQRNDLPRAHARERAAEEGEVLEVTPRRAQRARVAVPGAQLMEGGKRIRHEVSCTLDLPDYTVSCVYMVPCTLTYCESL